MRFLYNAFRFLPYWGIPVAFILFELGQFFRRKGNRVYLVSWGLSVWLVISVVLWIFFRGDKHSDAWVRSLFGP